MPDACDCNDPNCVFAAPPPAAYPDSRIAYYQPGWQRASVVDAASGKRHRQILVASLHAAAVTDKGTRRRNGYALDTATNRSVLNA